MNRSLLTLIPFVTAASLAFAADSVTLNNGNSLTGILTDSDAPGMLSLDHPEASELLKIRESSVKRIIFDASTQKNSSLTESIKLLNGDHFPCSITSLNAQSVTFTSDSVGTHTISRNAIDQIKFNTKANKTIYTGPGDDLSAWTTTSEDWKLSNGKLSTNLRSEASIPIPKLTENYILEFKTAWSESTPQLRICFSSDRRQADRKSDYYSIDINTHGITIGRSKLGDFKPIGSILATDKMFAQSSLNVAIYVDRKHKKLALYLNGNLVKTITDPRIAPTGKYLVIKNLQRNGMLTEISNMKVSSWNGKVVEEAKSKSNTLSKHDLITDLTGNVITGQIIGLTRKGSTTSLNFKAPFAKSDSTIAGKVIDTLEFKTAEEPPDLGEPVYHLSLRSGGLVSFTNSQMTSGKLTVDHPLLGKISLPKATLSTVGLIPEPPKEDEQNEQDEQ